MMASTSTRRVLITSGTKGITTPRKQASSASIFSTPGTGVGARSPGVDSDAMSELRRILEDSSQRVLHNRESSDRIHRELSPIIDKILETHVKATDVTIEFQDVSGYGARTPDSFVQELSLNLTNAAISWLTDELHACSQELGQDLSEMKYYLTQNSSDTETMTPLRGHFVTLDTVITTLETIGTELEKTRGAVATLVSRKKKLTADLIEFWTDVGDDVSEILRDDNSEEVDEVSESDGKNAARNTKIETEVKKIDTQITSLQSHIQALRGAIKATLANHYNTPEYDWNTEPKKLQQLKLDPKLAGAPDPTLVDSLLVAIRTLLHGHVSLFWTCIPYLECMDSDREYADHWNYPCEANEYDGIPENLLDIYKSQSAFLFQHIWNSSDTTANMGAQILRKTFGEKFLGDFFDTEASIKSTKHDGMMSVFYLVSVHASAGYQERARLRSTLHHAASMFISGNPQQKLPAIRVIIDKATTLRVKIDYEATIKPICMTLRQRSPNFNDLATKYLRDQTKLHLADWDNTGLDHLDTLLSEIEFIVENYGMQSNLPSLTDQKSKADEASAKAAFAAYNIDGGSDGNGKSKNNSTSGNQNDKTWVCGAEGCKNKIKDSVKNKQIARRKEMKEKGEKPKSPYLVCTECYGKLRSGEVSVIKLKNGSERVLNKKGDRNTNANRSEKKRNGDNDSQDDDDSQSQASSNASADTKTAVLEVMSSLFGPPGGGTSTQQNEPASQPQEQNDLMAQFKAKWDALELK